MNTYTLFILCCSFALMYCDDLGGVKVAINQKFIRNMISSLENEIRNKIQKIKIPDSGGLEDGEFGIPNFNSRMINLQFQNNGIIDLTLSDCVPYFSGAYYYKILFFNSHNNFHANFENFKLHLKIKIKSRNVPGGFAPDAEIISGPDVDFNLDISTDGFLHGLISWVINKSQNLVKPLVLPKLKEHAREQMLNIIKKFETKLQVGDGFWLDFTLKTPIQIKNKFLELNSIAHFYHEKFFKTQNRTRYQENKLPSINLVGNQFQLFVSEYSINTAIYTLLTAYNKEITFKVNTKVLNSMLPGIVEKYGEKQVIVSLNQYPDAKVQITEKYFGINIPSSLSIKLNEGEKKIFDCDLLLSLKVDMKVINQNKQNYASGNIKELSAKITKVKFNIASKSFNSIIESGFGLIQDTIIKLLNNIIDSQMKVRIPPIMGVTLLNINFVLKNGYFAVNYNIQRKCQIDVKSIFDANFYKKKYKDMEENDDNEVFTHYVEHGINEGRSPSQAFDPNTYLFSNQDIYKAYGLNYRKAYEHFINNACYEKRELSPVFNLGYYMEKNPDLINAYDDDFDAIIKHFLNNGMKEGRISSTKFDFKAYKSRYFDLRNQFKNNNKEYYTHYCIKGINENRIPK